MKDSRDAKSYTDGSRKKKKKKHKKRYQSSSSSDSLSDGEVKWVEAPSQSQTKAVKKKKKSKKKSKYRSSSSDSDLSNSHNQKCETSSVHLASEKRESWMNEETFVPTLCKEDMVPISSSRQKRIDALQEQQGKEKKIQQERELNPHWKNDGTGLPEKEANVESLSLPSTSVGDGGYSWLKKAYYRIQEQAQTEGRSMEDIAVERWGSLSKLVSMIEEAEARMKSHPDHKRKFYRIRDEYERDTRQSITRQFKKPQENVNENRHGFESPFEFKKPSHSSEHDKKLNQFKSSRKSYSYSYTESKGEQSDSRNFSPSTRNLEKRCSELGRVDQKDLSNKDHIPAWKKPKCTEENHKNKELHNYTPEKHISSKKDDTEISVPDPKEMLVIYSEEDLNKLAARQMKAEIMGNTSLALTLKHQLEEARNIVKEKGFAQRLPKQVEAVVLTKLDSHGQSRPIQTTQEQISDYKHKKSNRGKYFDDGSKYSLKQMFEREKLTTADDQMEMFVDATVQCDDSSEIEFELGNVSKKLSQKLASGREEEKDIGRAIHQHQKLTAALEKCEFCLDQPRVKKYLIVDIGEQVYLSLPNYETITEGHCLIVPKAHVSSFLSLDEDEWREVDLFKNELRNMFRAQRKTVIFLQSSMNFRYHPHAVIECIPVPEDDAYEAPIYFKKAIQESEAEWANNVKLIDLSKKGLRNSVPKNLPYFHVEFDPKLHAGFAHVIEDERSFPRNFGKEVLGGMLDIDFHQLYKNKKEDTLKKTKEVLIFEKMWKAFKSDNC